jgi:hypothetical protein
MAAGLVAADAVSLPNLGGALFISGFCAYQYKTAKKK